jgi:hypothetical protein
MLHVSRIATEPDSVFLSSHAALFSGFRLKP